jgi:hypothetical protein
MFPCPHGETVLNPQEVGDAVNEQGRESHAPNRKPCNPITPPQTSRAYGRTSPLQTCRNSPGGDERGRCVSRHRFKSMDKTVCHLCDLIWSMTMIVGCVWLVFFKSISGWWFVLAVMLAGCWKSCEDEAESA